MHMLSTGQRWPGSFNAYPTGAEAMLMCFQRPLEGQEVEAGGAGTEKHCCVPAHQTCMLLKQEAHILNAI